MSARRERQLDLITPNMQRYEAVLSADWLDAIKRQVCPFCGEGPFTVVAIHVSKKHGIDRFQLRDMLGLTYTRTALCDPTHSQACALRITKGDLNGRLIGRPATGKHRYSKAAKTRLADLSRQMAAEHLESVAERDRSVVALITAGRLTYAEIAQRMEVSPETVAAIARRNRLPKTPGRQPLRPPRLCSIDGCDRVHKGHGLCKLHLRRHNRAEP